MGQLPVLRFEPLLKEAVWGGRRMEGLLDRRLPGGGPIGESWELVDLPSDQSLVRGGPFDGTSLEAILAKRGRELLGGAALLDGRFPLLFKFIDANSTLSVQVHPDEAACARLRGGARPKTEAWYIIEAAKGASLYVGLVEGVSRERFADALAAGKVEELLNRVPVSPGDLAYLPAGTIHAIGEGIVLAEVQQSSATTYRVFDWNRVGLDGKPRTLHLEQALESIHFGSTGAPTLTPPPSGARGLACPFFSMELHTPGGGTVSAGGDGPLVLMGVGGRGTATVRSGGDRHDLGLGETLLVPACRSGEVELDGGGGLTVLAVRIPTGQV
jgi:mannose-6-phosphate isomerase